MSAEFWQYELVSDGPLCIGERIKKGTFRPCLTKAIPFSSIVGALRPVLGLDYAQDLVAAGYIVGYKHREYLVMAPHDIAQGGAKLPLTAETLSGVTGKVFVDVSHDVVREALEDLGASFEIVMGAMKSAGFGRCKLTRAFEDVPLTVVTGTLRTRIPEKHSGRFGIIEVHKAEYGYLFERIDDVSGMYVKSLYEKSTVSGYSFLVKEGDVHE